MMKHNEGGLGMIDRKDLPWFPRCYREPLDGMVRYLEGAADQFPISELKALPYPFLDFRFSLWKCR